MRAPRCRNVTLLPLNVSGVTLLQRGRYHPRHPLPDHQAFQQAVGRQPVGPVQPARRDFTGGPQTG